MFIAGILVGLGVETTVAQNQNAGRVGLNHVGINVPDLDATVACYTETMGFPEAFRKQDDRGQSALVYVQISKNTCVDLQPANGRPMGVSHFGIHVEDRHRDRYGDVHLVGSRCGGDAQQQRRGPS